MTWWKRTEERHVGLLIGLLAIHAVLSSVIAWSSSPNCDELAHLASGLYHWQTGRWDAYRVNPPLVRLWASLPLVCLRPQVRWTTASGDAWHRSEWQLAQDLTRELSEQQLRTALFAGRTICLIFPWLGMTYCHRWACRSHGPVAGVTAAALWAFCPNLLAWGRHGRARCSRDGRGAGRALSQLAMADPSSLARLRFGGYLVGRRRCHKIHLPGLSHCRARMLASIADCPRKRAGPPASSASAVRYGAPAGNMSSRRETFSRNTHGLLVAGRLCATADSDDCQFAVHVDRRLHSPRRTHVLQRFAVW